MTRAETRAKMSILAHQRDKILRGNTSPTKYQHQELTKIARQHNQLIKAHRLEHSFTPNSHFTELFLATQYIQHNKLMLVFSFYDGRGRSDAIIPRSFYDELELERILKVTIKKLPKQLQKFGLRGYRLSLEKLADILDIETSKQHLDNIKNEKRVARLKQVIGKTDCRPHSAHL